jgi:hypothetical protein
MEKIFKSLFPNCPVSDSGRVCRSCYLKAYQYAKKNGLEVQKREKRKREKSENLETKSDSNLNTEEDSKHQTILKKQKRDQLISTNNVLKKKNDAICACCGSELGHRRFPFAEKPHIYMKLYPDLSAECSSSVCDICHKKAIENEISNDASRTSTSVIQSGIILAHNGNNEKEGIHESTGDINQIQNNATESNVGTGKSISILDSDHMVNSNAINSANTYSSCDKQIMSNPPVKYRTETHADCQKEILPRESVKCACCNGNLDRDPRLYASQQEIDKLLYPESPINNSTTKLCNQCYYEARKLNIQLESEEKKTVLQNGNTSNQIEIRNKKKSDVDSSSKVDPKNEIEKDIVFESDKENQNEMDHSKFEPPSRIEQVTKSTRFEPRKKIEKEVNTRKAEFNNEKNILVFLDLRLLQNDFVANCQFKDGTIPPDKYESISTIRIYFKEGVYSGDDLCDTIYPYVVRELETINVEIVSLRMFNLDANGIEVHESIRSDEKYHLVEKDRLIVYVLYDS